jgi:hypothetical protein
MEPMDPTPTFTQVLAAVRMALNSPDPVDRAEGASRLELWDLPVAPVALGIAVERIKEASYLATYAAGHPVGKAKTTGRKAASSD